MRKAFFWWLFFLIVFLSLSFSPIWASLVVIIENGGGNEPVSGGEGFQIESPLKWKTFRELFEAIVDLLFTLASIIAPLMIIIAGFYFITSAGDPQKVRTAQKIILYTLIGFLIILLSKGIIALWEEVLGIRE